MIVRSRKNVPDLPRGESSDVKPKMIELERKIGHNSVMSICEFFMDIDGPDHLVDQAIHDMKGIGDVSDEGKNGMDKLFGVDFLVDGADKI